MFGGDIDIDHQACFTAVHDGGTTLGAEVLGGGVSGTVATVGGVMTGSYLAGFGAATANINGKFDGPIGVLNGIWTGGDRGAQRELNAILMCDSAKGQAGGYAPFDEGFVGSGSPTVAAFDVNGSVSRARQQEALQADPAMSSVGMTREQIEAWNTCKLRVTNPADPNYMQKINDCVIDHLEHRTAANAPSAPPRQRQQTQAPPAHNDWN